jgi:WD40 repeat protein
MAADSGTMQVLSGCLSKNTATFDAKARYLFASCGSLVKAFSRETGESIYTLAGHKDQVTSTAIPPNNPLQLLSSSLDGTGEPPVPVPA